MLIFMYFCILKFIVSKSNPISTTLCNQKVAPSFPY